MQLSKYLIILKFLVCTLICPNKKRIKYDTLDNLILIKHNLQVTVCHGSLTLPRGSAGQHFSSRLNFCDTPAASCQNVNGKDRRKERENLHQS